MAKKKDEEAEPEAETPPAPQTPIGGDVDGTQTPNPISDPSQMEKS